MDMQLSKIGIIGVPYSVSSFGSGADKSPEALRKAGIVNALKKISVRVEDLGDAVTELPLPDISNPKLRNPGQVVVLCRVLAKRIQSAMEDGYFPFVIGGDDSILMGIIEGLRKTLGDRIGLIYMDAHGDFNVPETTPSGIIGGMDVAITAGRGARELTQMFDHSPILPEGNIVLYGVRALDEMEKTVLTESKVKVYSRKALKTLGVEQAVKKILRDLQHVCDRIFLHVDIDVLDASVISAQALTVPDGLSSKEFQKTLQVLVESNKLCGIAVMMFDAPKDHGGKEARKLVNLVTNALRG
jgi:arginase